MLALPPEDLQKAHQLYRTLQQGDGLTQDALDDLQAQWEPIAQPHARERSEHFCLARPDGGSICAWGPRWLFHLLGLRHRAVEIGFWTPAGLIVLQRRSPTKDQWPDALDMAVAGHLAQQADGSDMTFEQGAWKEIEEEIGLPESGAASFLVEGKLIPIGDPYTCFEGDWRRNPPFLDAEVRQIYGATLTGEALARLRFADHEVAGLLLVTPETAWQILRQENIASGLRYSLPRLLDWLANRQTR